MFYLVSIANSLTLPCANLNIMLALMQYHLLVQRGILTQALREIDLPHGFRRLWSQTPSCNGVCVWKPQQQAVIWKTGHAHNDSTTET